MVAATPPTAATLKKSLRDGCVKVTSASGRASPDTYFYVVDDYLVKKHSRAFSTIATRIHTTVIFAGAASCNPDML
jgi:hypothetical protein